jgi:hypothetical protein
VKRDLINLLDQQRKIELAEVNTSKRNDTINVMQNQEI